MFFLMIFWILCTIQWYLKLPLRVPLSPAEISVNGPMVFSGIQWYSMVFNGIPLALFCKGCWMTNANITISDMIEKVNRSYVCEHSTVVRRFLMTHIYYMCFANRKYIQLLKTFFY